MADDLFELRNNFYLRNYQAAINDGVSASVSSAELALEREVLVNRCYIGLGNYRMVLDEAAHEGDVGAVRLLAELLQSREDSISSHSDQPLQTIAGWIQNGQATPTILVIASIMYTIEGNRDEAIRVVNQCNNLEGKALLIQHYLALSRLDLAEKEYGAMQQLDEDATLTQLANAWIGLHKGGDKLQEAFYIYQELSDKYSPGPLVLNGQAVCNMQKGQFEEAEGLLLEALEKNSKDSDTLANLIVCSQQLNKPPARYLKQLKIVDPTHPWVSDYDAFEQAFERSASRYSAVRA